MAEPKYLSGDPSAISAFLDKFDTFLIDCDGTRESVPFKTIKLLQSKGKRTVFVTNNSTKSRKEYYAKLSSKGIPCQVEDIFGSSYSAAIYISRILKLEPPRNKVFVLGEAGIEAELESEGVPYIGGTDPKYRKLGMEPEDFAGIADGSTLDPDVGVVLAGLDFHVNYFKLAHAHGYLRGNHVKDAKNAKDGGKAIFLATNIDSTLPMYHNFFPGAGSASVVALSNMTGDQPLALGKPSQAMMDAVEGKFHLDRSRTCMIGDRLNTDIQFGVEGNLGGTLAVLTGVNKKEDWEKADAPAVPAYYVDGLADLRG
ncbi:p-nitrophenyl phosphatase [Sporothrix bragantina]|uniref:4-nitrophenylphosphatase n=1 Tax=Sporothrix bragantina TaxID=671064 RepID=A0ABP0BGC7_9PEZI